MSKYFRRKSPLPWVTGFLFSVTLLSMPVAAESDIQDLTNQAQTKYEMQDYAAALETTQQALKLAPGSSGFHHMLGRCYGKLASQANWFKAPSLARKALRAFEKAIELDNRNIAALLDLREYYRQAPRFVGGNKDKAKKIDDLLIRLESTS